MMLGCMMWMGKKDGFFNLTDLGVHIFHPCRGSFYFPCAIQKRYVKAHEFQHTKILVFVSVFRVRHGVAYHRSQFIASQLLICPVCVFPEIMTNGVKVCLPALVVLVDSIPYLLCVVEESQSSGTDIESEREKERDRETARE